MEARMLQDTFIRILGSELTGNELDCSLIESITPDTALKLYQLSKKHDLAHIVSLSLYKNKAPIGPELTECFSKEEMLAVYRHEQREHAYVEVCRVLENENIRYVPLKGCVLKKYYPQESMRTSCDIDMLIKEEAVASAASALERLGYKCNEKNFHDISFYSPSGVHIELHFSILENTPALDEVLKDVWQYVNNSFELEGVMSKEFFVFYMFAHISYHFLSGGCGVRSLMDIWVVKHKMGYTYEDAKRLLEKAGILVFAEKMQELADICFCGKEQNLLSREMLDYILNGGVYGDMKNRIAIKGRKERTTLSYGLNRIFVSYEALTMEYPILKKCCFLMLFCWLHRTFKLFFRFAKRIFKRRRANKTVSNDNVNNALSLKSRLGLQHIK